MTHCCSTFRLPHAFYPVQTEGYIEIGPGDKLAARCIMVNDQDHVITTGPKDTDEMCIFYVMFYVESKNEPLLSQVLHSTNLQFGDISKLNHFENGNDCYIFKICVRLNTQTRFHNVFLFYQFEFPHSVEKTEIFLYLFSAQITNYVLTSRTLLMYTQMYRLSLMCQFIGSIILPTHLNNQFVM